MKKKILSALAASAFVVSGAFNAVGSAIVAEATAPSIEVDLTYDYEYGEWARADIYLKNVPNIAQGSFYVQFGSDWDISYYDFESNNGKSQNTTNLDMSTSNNRIWLFFNAHVDTDMNGYFGSIYLDRYTITDPENATANIQIDNFSKANGTFVAGEEFENPLMTKANEYIIGDANGDGIVTLADSAAIQQFMDDRNMNPVALSTLRGTIGTCVGIGNAKDYNAPNANLDNYISLADSVAIVQYYDIVRTGGVYNGEIGHKDICEYFDGED